MLALASGAAARAGAAAEPGLLVLAAASLKNALDEVGAVWERETGGRARFAYAASSALARQIEGGAPADILILADPLWMDYLEERGLIDRESRMDLLGNRLVLIAPADSDVALALEPGVDLRAALGDGRLAMAEVTAVPAGRYGKAALERLGAWHAVADRLAQAENVRAALAFVARGEAPLGIVYETDAAAEPGVRIIALFPEDSHPPIRYPIALLAGSRHPAAADFLRFAASRRAAAIFLRWGFIPLPGSSEARCWT